MKRAGIVGAGIMGRLLALALHKSDWQVSLFDENEGDTNCSHVAAGLLTPISELDKTDLLIFKLGQESIKTAWPAIVQSLAEKVYFQQKGSIVVSHPNDQAEWMHFNQRLSSQLKASAYYQNLSSETLLELEPELSKFKTAYYFPDEAQIDSQAMMAALKTDLTQKGVKYLMNTPVTSIQPGLIITENQQHTFDMVFDCRGLGARSVFSDLRALRGELIWLHAPEVNLKRPIRLLHPRYSLYIVPRPGNIYLVGASEIEAEDYSTISVRTTLELLTAVYYVHAGFAEARIIKTLTHCRPTLPDHLPHIKFTEGLIAVNGLYRRGYLMAPALAEEILRGMNQPEERKYPEIWKNYDN